MSGTVVSLLQCTWYPDDLSY